MTRKNSKNDKLALELIDNLCVTFLNKRLGNEEAGIKRYLRHFNVKTIQLGNV